MKSRLAMFCALVVGAAFAQSNTGSIGGRVTDTTGLPISGAQIVVTEEATNTAIKTTTNDSGDYNVSYLKPGSWKVEFQKDGFKAHAVTGIQLQLDQQRRVDLAMQVGETTESVLVTATTDQVNLVSPEIGQVVDSEQLVDLPQLATNGRGRSPFLLAKLLPGVTTNGNNYTNINGFSFAGGRRTTNEILVDGLPTTN